MSYKSVNHGYLISGQILDNTNHKSYDVSNMILNVLVKKAFIEDVFPLYVIDFKTTIEFRDIMRDNEVSLALRISYYDIDSLQTEEEMDTTNVVELGVLFDGIIRIYDKPFPTTASKIEDENDDGETQKTTAPFVYYRMSGIPEDLISKNEETMNNIYKDCEVIDVAVNMLSTVDKTSKIFIQESKNKTKYSDILIPPVSLVPGIRFLDENFEGIYTRDSNLFIDSGEIFLYDPLEMDGLTTNIIECNIISPEATAENKILQFPSIDEKNNIKLSYKNLPAFSTTKYLTDHTFGDFTQFYTYDEYFNLSLRNETNTSAYKKTRYIWQIMSSRKTDMLKVKSSLAITLNNINPYLINPLTKLKIISAEYPTANGDYSIVSSSFIFSSTDMKHYKSNLMLSAVKK